MASRMISWPVKLFDCCPQSSGGCAMVLASERWIKERGLEAVWITGVVTDCTNTEGILRIIMAVPSPKAEPFKLWLAQVGRERMDEIENPELGIERIRALYKAKGYSDEWISSRLKRIDIRKELTEEWQNRGVKQGQEYSILTAEIAKATFGLTPSKHKTLKNLDKQKLLKKRMMKFNLLAIG